jgi:hypothetical protein
MPTETARVRNVIGANMSVRADVLRETGGFEGSFGRTDRAGKAVTGTADDTEFCIRATEARPDGVWLFQPRARVRHSVPPQRTTWAFFRTRCRLEGAAKAQLTEVAGNEAALASERAYVRSTLPRGIARELRAGFRGDVDALRRGGVIVIGLSLTTITYVKDMLRRRWESRRAGS